MKKYKILRVVGQLDSLVMGPRAYVRLGCNIILRQIRPWRVQCSPHNKMYLCRGGHLGSCGRQGGRFWPLLLGNISVPFQDLLYHS